MAKGKLASSFPENQFHIPGYKLFRNDRKEIEVVLCV